MTVWNGFEGSVYQIDVSCVMLPTIYHSLTSRTVPSMDSSNIWSMGRTTSSVHPLSSGFSVV